MQLVPFKTGMDWRNALHIFLILDVVATVVSFNFPGCGDEDYERCVQMADPLIRESHLIFPDNMQDLDFVCRKWNNLVDCIKHFTDRCFTEKQRRQFNKAIENPIQSIHQMCTQPLYQREYLHYAPCMKDTVTERAYCAPHYTLLLEQVSQRNVISESVLCCSQHQFRDCVLREARRICDRGLPDGPATRFATHIIDKSLSFWQKQCLNDIPNSGDCGSSMDTKSFSEPLVGSTPSSVESRWNSHDEQGSSSKSILTSILTPPRASATPSWIDTSDISETNSSSTLLGSSHSRSSFGRAHSWPNGPSSWSSNPSENTQPLDNTVQTFSESPPAVSSPPTPWATTSSWHDMGPTRGDLGSSAPQLTSNDHQLSSPSTDGQSSSGRTNEVPPREINQSLSSAVQTSEDGSSPSALTPDGSTSLQAGSSDGLSRTPIVISQSPELFGQSPGIVSESTYEVSFLTTETVTASSETWYPAAGSQLSNEVDEPNQQGWIKPDGDSKGIKRESYLSLTFIVTMLTIFC